MLKLQTTGARDTRRRAYETPLRQRRYPLPLYIPQAHRGGYVASRDSKGQLPTRHALENSFNPS